MARRPQGVGISLRREHYADVVENTRRLDWIEMNPENVMAGGPYPRSVLEKVASDMPVYAHGVSLSIGGPDPLDEAYLSPLKELLDQLNPEYFSDHCSYAMSGGIVLHDLYPLPFTDEAIKHVVARCRQVQDRLNRPLILENPSYYAIMPTSYLSEGQFITAILEEADIGFHLDVNNVYVNARNHNRDPRDVLNELPLHRTRHIHLAGHKDEGHMVIDTHGAEVADPVWDLYREVIERLGAVPTIIEWEQNVPTWDRLLDEADRARAIQEEVRARKAS
jgi:uncharacterized protein